MIIRNRINTTITNARMTRVAKTRTFNAARRSSGNTSSADGSIQSLLDKLYKEKNASPTEKLLENQKESYSYEVMRQAAVRVQGHLGKLGAEGEDSIFGREDQKAAAEEAAKNILNFVSDYNIMVGKLRGSDSMLENSYADKMKDLMTASSADLKKIGISVNKNGTLTLDEKVLKDADIGDMKKLFGPEGKLTAQIAEQASLSEKSADRMLETLKLNSYQISQNYNRYGSDDSGFGGGSWYNVKG